VTIYTPSLLIDTGPAVVDERSRVRDWAADLNGRGSSRSPGGQSPWVSSPVKALDPGSGSGHARSCTRTSRFAGSAEYRSPSIL